MVSRGVIFTDTSDANFCSWTRIQMSQQSTIFRPPYCPPLLKLSNSMLNMCSELAKWNLKHTCTVYIVFGHSNGPCDFFGINYKSNRFWKFLKNESTPPETLQNSFGLKKSTKSATTLIFFFQWKLRCCSFQISHWADTRADTLLVILVLSVITISKKNQNF